MDEEKRLAAAMEMQKLLDVGFIKEIQYTTWLFDVVLVKKNNGHWWMCVDYTYLNKACPKDVYPMCDRDVGKTVFITKASNCCYKLMPFRLKNAGFTYQRLMDQVFKDQIGRNMEVYVDDMVVKSEVFDQHIADLKEVFRQLCHFGMRVNPTKCVFGVERGKFLGFMLTQRNRSQPQKMCGHFSNVEPYKTKRGTKSHWKTNISLSFFA